MFLPLCLAARASSTAASFVTRSAAAQPVSTRILAAAGSSARRYCEVAFRDGFRALPRVVDVCGSSGLAREELGSSF